MEGWRSVGSSVPVPCRFFGFMGFGLADDEVTVARSLPVACFRLDASGGNGGNMTLKPMSPPALSSHIVFMPMSNKRPVRQRLPAARPC